MTIAEVSKKYGLSADTLRYYEKIGLIDPVSKDTSGRRDYQEKDLRRINFLKCMRTAGLSIELLKKYVDLFHEGEETIPERKELLFKQKAIIEEKMAELQDTLEYLNHKIEVYDDTLVKREKVRNRTN